MEIWKWGKLYSRFMLQVNACFCWNVIIKVLVPVTLRHNNLAQILFVACTDYIQMRFRSRECTCRSPEVDIKYNRMETWLSLLYSYICCALLVTECQKVQNHNDMLKEKHHQ